MAKEQVLRGQTSNIAFCWIGDTTSTTGGGKTGLTNASAGLIVAVRREKSAAMTAYSGANIGAVSTLGTWADPGSGKCNFKEVDATNAPGLYEIHFRDSVFDTSDTSRKLIGMVTVTGGVGVPFEMTLAAVDPQSATAFITGVNSLAPPANWNLMVVDASGRIDLGKWIGNAPAALTTNGYVQAMLLRWLTDNAGGTPSALATNRVDASVGAYPGNTAQTGDNYARIGAPVGASISADIAGVQSDTDNIQTRIPAALTANGNMKSSILEMITTLLTEGAVGRLKAAFTTLFDVAAPVLTTASVNQTGDSYARLGAPAGASIAADLAEIEAETDGIGSDTGGVTTLLARIPGTVQPQTGDSYARLGAPVGASISADVAGVQADTDNLQTRIPAALVSGRMDSSVGAYPGNTAQTGDSFARLGAPTGASIAADIAEVEAETDGIGSDTAGVTTLLGRIPGVVQPQTGDSYARIGAPVGASISADIAEVEAETDNIGNDTAGVTTLLARIPGTVQPQTGDSYVRLGAPSGASIAADIAEVEAETDGIPTVVQIRQEMDANSVRLATLIADMDRLEGLAGKNRGLRNYAYDGNNDLTSVDICLYDTAMDAVANDGATGLIGKYTVTNTYSSAHKPSSGVSVEIS